MKTQHKPPHRQPQRTCIVCRQTQDKRGLIRIVRTSLQGVQIDERGKTPGRGAYLCHTATCWEKALQSNVLAQALKTALSDDECERLRTFMSVRVLKAGEAAGVASTIGSVG